MNLETSKKLLKISGILLIIGAILTAFFGGFFAYAGDYASKNMPEAQTNPDYKTVSILLLVAGILLLISGVVHFLQGIFSYKASKDPAYGKKAYTFSILGLIMTLISTVSQLSAKNITASTVFSIILGIVLSIIIMIAAKKVKDEYIA